VIEQLQNEEFRSRTSHSFSYPLVLLSSFQGSSSINTKWCDQACYDDLWFATGEVPEKLADVPPQPLFMGYGGRTILPNDTVNTDEMLDWPTLRWEEEEGALYTVYIGDFGIEYLEGGQYIHWMISNVASPFTVDAGDEVN
jgi:hypothetical protein